MQQVGGHFPVYVPIVDSNNVQVLFAEDVKVVTIRMDVESKTVRVVRFKTHWQQLLELFSRTGGLLSLAGAILVALFVQKNRKSEIVMTVNELAPIWSVYGKKPVPQDMMETSDDEDD